jgi:hypothetical protein
MANGKLLRNPATGNLWMHQQRFSLLTGQGWSPRFLSGGTVGVAYPTPVILWNVLDNPQTMYTLLSGSLPPGLSLATESGSMNWASISGTPTTAGTYTFTIKATHYAHDTLFDTRQYAITIADPGGGGGAGDITFMLAWDNYLNAIPEFGLYVIDPADYGYGNEDPWMSDGDFYWPVKPASVYRSYWPPYGSVSVSPNTGRVNAYCSYGYYSQGHYFYPYQRPPQTVFWTSGSSPSGVFLFWIVFSLTGIGSSAPCTISVLKGTTVLWTRTLWMLWPSSSYIWRFNSANNSVY